MWNLSDKKDKQMKGDLMKQMLKYQRDFKKRDKENQDDTFMGSEFPHKRLTFDNEKENDSELSNCKFTLELFQEGNAKVDKTRLSMSLFSEENDDEEGAVYKSRRRGLFESGLGMNVRKPKMH